MTSKSSFLVNIRENNKRRLWVWVVSALAFMLALPVATALRLNSFTFLMDGWVTLYGEELAGQMLKERMLEAMGGWFGFNGGRTVLVSMTGIISAVQGFSWLYSRKKMDFYLGMPVKRKKRFLLIWLNGILLYVIPYLFGTLASLMIAAGDGAVGQSVLAAALASFGGDFGLYLGVYHMAMLAVMMTGNIVITGFGILVFALYEYLVRVTVNGYKQLFFRYYVSYGSSDMPVLSPFAIYGKLANVYEAQGRLKVTYMAGLLLFALAVGAAAYFCYLKRPAETAGRAMAFAVTRPIIKILLVTPLSLAAGLAVVSTLGLQPGNSRQGMGYMIFAIALVAVIGSAFIQVIYEFDIKGALHQKKHILISGLAAAAIFAVFRLDLLGYDSYIPSPGQVESVAFVPDYYEDANGSIRLDEDGVFLSEKAYAERYMYLDSGEEVCRLADISMEGYNQLWEQYNNGMDVWEETGQEQKEYWSQAMVIYRLKGGRKVYRNLWVNVEDEETARLLDNIIGSAQFKEGYFAIASERMDRIFEQKYQVEAFYGNSVYRKKMGKAEMGEFLERYRRDFGQADFSDLKENVPVGVMELAVSEELSGTYGGTARATRSWEMNMNIYPFYTETIAWLKERGYYSMGQVSLEDVARIQVLNYNTEVSQKLLEGQKTQGGMAATELASWVSSPGEKDTWVYGDYTEAEEIERIAGCIFPRGMVSRDWDNGKMLDYGYNVIVYFKTDSEITKEYGAYADYGFLEGEIPDLIV